MKVAQFQLVVACLLCLRLPAGSAEEAALQWPQFRGPGGQGIASGQAKLPAEFGTSKNILWKTPVILGHSSPCVWGNRLFLTGADAKERKLVTVCLDRADGRIIWQKSVTVNKLEALHQLNSPASSSPATDGRRVYVYFGSYGLLAYDLGGNELWKKPLSATPSWFGSGTSPVVVGDRVLLNCGTEGNFSLLALDPASGEALWEKERPQGSATGQWSTPMVRQTADGTQEVFVAGGMRSSAYSLEDGTERWAISDLPATSLSTAVVGDGLIFFSLTNPFGEPDNILQLPGFDEALAKYDSNADGKIAADEIPADLMLFVRGRADTIGDWSPLQGAVGGHDAHQDGSLNKDEWQALVRQQSDMAASADVVAVAVRPGGAVNDRTGEVVWKQTTAVPEVPSLLYYNHRIYLVSEKGILTCRDATSGKERYKQRLGIEGTCYASPVVGDDKIYVASDGGTIVVFRPGDQYQLCATNAFDEGILATPALVDGTIYVRTRGHLYACAAPADAR